MKSKLRSLTVRSNKEIFDSVTLAVGAGITTFVVFATAVNDYVGTVGTCPLGATIKALNVQVSYQSGDAAAARMDWYICKQNGAAAGLVLPTPGATGGSPFRKFIFHESKGINPDDDGGPSNQKGWISVPKLYHRMGEDDKLIIAHNASNIHDVCIKVIYKWRA